MPDKRVEITKSEVLSGIQLEPGELIVIALGDVGERKRDAPPAGIEEIGPAGARAGGAAAAPAAAALGKLDLQLVNVAGAPAAGLEVELTLPDGTKEAGETDANGHFVAKDLPTSGSCTLELPDIDEATTAAASASSGRTRYARGMSLPIGTPAVIELPARVTRGQLTGAHFETDKTFLLPSAMPGIKQLVVIYNSFKASSALVVGHTDTVGSADRNRGLSEERAASVAAFLTDDVDGWLENYKPRKSSQAWGVREDQHMLTALGFYTGAINGSAVSAKPGYLKFQGSQGLDQSGKGDEATRRALVTAYMATDGTSLPKGTKALTHGCGLTHLAVPTGPNVANAENRRVEVFMFDGDVTPLPQPTCPPKGCDEHQQWVGQTLNTVDLDQSLPSLDVQVKDENGQDVDAATVHLAGPTQQDLPTTSGTASFPALVPGKYKAIASKQDFTAADAETTVVQGTNAPLVITLQGLATLDVTVTLAAPQKTAQVTATPVGKPALGPSPASPTAQFLRVPSGPCTVNAQAPFHRQGIQGTTLSRGTNKLTLKLDPFGELAGKVTDGSSPVQNVIIELTGPSSRNANSDASGAYQFGNLPLGNYKLKARKPGFTDFEKDLVVSASRTVFDVVLEKLTLEAFVRFEAWNVQTLRFEPVANMKVDAVDDGTFSNATLDSRTTDATGLAHIQVTSKKRKPGAEIDLFFLAHPDSRVIGGNTFPKQWSTKGWLATDGSLGFRDDFKDAAIGSTAAPVVFRIGLDLHLRITYDVPPQPARFPGDTPSPGGTFNAVEGVNVEMRGIGTFGLNPRGEIHGILFNVGAGDDLVFDIGETIENKAINLKKATFNFDSEPGFRVTLAKNRNTSIGTQTAPRVINGIGPRAAAMYVFKVLSEWSQFLTHVSGGDWDGVADLDFFPHTLGGTSYSFPVGTVNLEKVDFFDRGVIAHELSHQIMWKLCDVGTAGIIGKFLTGKLHLKHSENLLTDDESHPLIEGWAEFMESIFNKGHQYNVALLTKDVDKVGTIPLKPPLSRGEHCEGAFANALFDVYVNRMGGKQLPESNDGNALQPFVDAPAVRAAWKSMIWDVLKDLKSTSPFATRTFCTQMKKRNLTEWHRILPDLHRWNLMMDQPIVDSIVPASAAGGTNLTINGQEFEDGATAVEFDGVASPAAPTSSTRLQIALPAGPPGKVRVVVRNAAGASAQALVTRT